MSNAKLSKRQAVLDFIWESRETINHAKHYAKTLAITEKDKHVLYEMVVMLCASISTFDKTIYPTQLFKEHITMPYTTAQRIFMKKGDTAVNIQTIHRTLDECEAIANQELGTLTDLKK